MKLVCVCFLFMSLTTVCFGYSQPIIKNTRAEGCIDGVCGSICSWEDVKLFPNDNLNQPGKCRLLGCSSDFNIQITPCPFDSEEIFNFVVSL